MNPTRPFLGHSPIFAIPLSHRGAEPYIVDPPLFPSGIVSKVVSESRDRADPKPTAWRQEMLRASRIAEAKIAAREGISGARVTQLMNLLELPDQIQNDRRNPPTPLQISSFRERRLRQTVARGDPQSQLRRWQELARE